MSVEIGMIVTGKVTGIKNFGAFVSLDGGKSGLVHISEVANTYVEDIQSHLQEGQEVSVKVIGIDDTGRINLSIKQTQAPALPKTPAAAPRPVRQAPQAARANVREVAPRGPVTFEDQLKQFMQESNSRMSGLEMYAGKKARRRSK